MSTWHWWQFQGRVFKGQSHRQLFPKMHFSSGCVLIDSAVHHQRPSCYAYCVRCVMDNKIAIPPVWNTLPALLCLVDNYTHFRRLLKARCLTDEAATCSHFLFRDALYKFSRLFMCLAVVVSKETGPCVTVDPAGPYKLVIRPCIYHLCWAVIGCWLDTKVLWPIICCSVVFVHLRDNCFVSLLGFW